MLHQKVRYTQKEFQNMNKDLTMIKAVLYHKELKQELYRASQMVDITNKLILMISVFFLVSSIF